MPKEIQKWSISLTPEHKYSVWKMLLSLTFTLIWPLFQSHSKSNKNSNNEKRKKNCDFKTSNKRRNKRNCRVPIENWIFNATTETQFIAQKKLRTERPKWKKKRKREWEPKWEKSGNRLKDLYRDIMLLLMP